MDTTKKYIEMCGMAKEIQEKRKKKFIWGDVYNDIPIDWLDKGKIPSISLITMPEERCESDIWLPRQDQLQEMMGFETYELLDICAESDGIMWQALHDYANSMEQLWLAFVMKEKWNKTWNGKEWKEV